MPLSADDIAHLYNRHARALLTSLTRRTHDPEVALDLMAETFAVAIAQRARFRGSTDAQAGGWLYWIARNELSSWYRRGDVERRAMERLRVGHREPTDAEYERIEEEGAVGGRRHRAHRPLRTLVLAVAFFVLLAAAAAAATVLVLHGAVIPAPAPDAVPAEMTPTPGSADVLDLRAEDPGEGPPFALRLSRSATGLACTSVGQVREDRFGVVGLDGRFRMLPVAVVDGCGRVAPGTPLLAHAAGDARPLGDRPPRRAPRHRRHRARRAHARALIQGPSLPHRVRRRFPRRPDRRYRDHGRRVDGHRAGRDGLLSVCDPYSCRRDCA